MRVNILSHVRTLSVCFVLLFCAVSLVGASSQALAGPSPQRAGPPACC